MYYCFVVVVVMIAIREKRCDVYTKYYESHYVLDKPQKFCVVHGMQIAWQIFRD